MTLADADFVPTSCSIMTPPPPSSARRAERIIAEHDRGAPGPTMIFVAGLHGNEPAGLDAARELFAELESSDAPFTGRAFALIGNVPACAIGARLIDVDLNRAFGYAIASAHDAPVPAEDLDPHAVESRERDELLATLREIVAAHPDGHDVYLIDLHTFSSDGAPFVVYSDTVRNRRLASCWPLPQILGLAEEVPGTLTDYATAAGCLSAVIETGRHDHPESAQRHVSVMRLALAHAGMWRAPEDVLDRDHTRLVRAAFEVPSTLDVVHRRGILPRDEFRMRPNYENFTPIHPGEHLADDRAGAIHAIRGGRILLPLYQKQGDDGYFIARPIGRFWLTLSAILRYLRLPGLVRWLPGVTPAPDVHDTLIVDRRIARWFVMDVFHLFGYRRVRSDDERVVVARRAPDLVRPSRVQL